LSNFRISLAQQLSVSFYFADYLSRFYDRVPYAREIAAGKFEGGEGSVDGHGIDALISERAPLYGKVVMDPTRDGAR
jgi:hypothetical protein